jgi:spermidine synthase
MEKSDIDRLFKEALEKNVMQAKVSFQDHERVVSFIVEKEIESEHQKIIIGRNESLGRLMVIDEEIQFTEVDFSVYHELMVWPAMILSGRKVKELNIAIYGGGDGLAANEILKFGVVPTIVDLDGSVINVCRDHFSDLNEGSLNRSHVIIGDALKHDPEEKYDILFVDLTDQVACPFLYDEAAIAKYKNDLKPGGLMLFYAEHMLARSFFPGLRRHFGHNFAYGAFTPFVDSYFTFCLFSDHPIDASKLKRTKRKGKYFCRQHVHEIDFQRLPKINFREKFEASRVASFVIKN